MIENDIEQEVVFRPGQKFRVVEIVDDANVGAHAGYEGPSRVVVLESVEG